MKLEEQLRRKIRLQGKADSTADAYVAWMKSYLRFVKESRGDWVHPVDLTESDFENWLTHLANEKNVSANTQNQAFSAICYLYREVLNQALGNVSAFRAKRPDRIREVLDQSEIIDLFGALNGQALLAAQLMYACSFRIGEVGRIRIKDISFERAHLIVRGGKGEKDRIVGFPELLHDPVRRQIESAKVLWSSDVAEGRKGVSLPKAWSRKSSSSHLDLAWWYLFPSGNYSKCPRTGDMLRHHMDMGNIARHIKNAAREAGILKRVTSHCLRHSFATHSLENGTPIHVVQKILGHANIETTETYLHVSKDGVTSAKSPLESTEMLKALLGGEIKQKRDNDEPTLSIYAG